MKIAVCPGTGYNENSMTAAETVMLLAVSFQAFWI
jgi:hypothetical protein